MGITKKERKADSGLFQAKFPKDSEPHCKIILGCRAPASSQIPLTWSWVDWPGIGKEPAGMSSFVGLRGGKAGIENEQLILPLLHTHR